MKRIYLLLFILFAAGLLKSGNAYSAWTQAKGHSYNQLTYSYYLAKNVYSTVANEGSDVVERRPSSKFSSRDVGFYTEYGVIDTLTIFTSFAYKQPTSDDALKYAGERGPSGIGDIDVGLRYNLAPNLFKLGDTQFSIQSTFTIPEAYDYGFPLSHLSNGDGHYSAKLDFMFGKGIGKGYLLCNLGYKYQFENRSIDAWDPNNPDLDRTTSYDFRYSDQIKFFLGGGYALHPKVELRGSLEYTKSIGNANVSDELLNAYMTYYGGAAEDGDRKLIKDTLGLEPEAVNLGVGLAISLTPQTQLVLSLNRDVAGFDWFRTKNAGEGTTYAAAFVYMH
ncbi:MAG: hypothetical protein HY809_01795 [Nitrospirae bacterium]|nr:hypothetical protein [Nitrospirota bacterium]